MVAAPASGQGKTTVVAALARLHRSCGRRVRVFKCGPDFLDPQIHALASGAPVGNVDLWMTGEDDIAARLYAAAGEADLILVESVMGLHDGSPSSADIARRFGLPVLAVIDARAMAQTFGALAHGLKHYRDGVNLCAVIANRIGSARHADMLRDSLPADIAWYGGLPRDERIALPERHLGLLPAAEIDGLDAQLDIAAQLLGASAAADLPPAVAFAPLAHAPLPRLLDGVRVAVARDPAFCFVYPANIECLRALGAELTEFSPLTDAALPDCDAVWLPGGYPELHAARWAGNTAMHASLRRHVDAGRPLLAECGGMMSLFETLADKAGACHCGAGLLPGTVRMQARLAALGLQQVALPEGLVRGHTFHYSVADTPLPPVLQASTPDGRPGEAVYRVGRLTASYVHLYFPSQPQAVAALFMP
ncbi:cobyrinate a,c-diamide synthase [Methyloversatilis thermotolerans]|uniref:cobyrinate a,c-diamide synthase n=1 Tax=Methyloversatilis thermotolerans TaxID=1346290 RepID=UPI00058B61B9|nr:cobyrinate a,c-diamide synthase [Methyloversatilis thermotolerans]